MVHLVILLSVVGFSLARAPTTPAAGGQGSGSKQGGGGQQGGGDQQGGGGQGEPESQHFPENSIPVLRRRKREFDETKVTLVTHHSFDPEMTAAYMKEIRSLMAQHAEELNLVVEQQRIEAKPENIDGKFAAVYNIHGAECNQINYFITTELVILLEYAIVTCGTTETTTLPPYMKEPLK
ncbi:hypothetical protein GCK32_004990 [Trichostrongylus colubriformis]|uniref:Uncharacterized protein n=1 Tax=Trichostrongylus colubriformis TaxID=6319 RepID=A0AAN8FU16_TRICO